MAHTDIAPPDFSFYRRSDGKDPTKKTTADERSSKKMYSYVTTMGMCSYLMLEISKFSNPIDTLAA